MQTSSEREAAGSEISRSHGESGCAARPAAAGGDRRRAPRRRATMRAVRCAVVASSRLLARRHAEYSTRAAMRVCVSRPGPRKKKPR